MSNKKVYLNVASSTYVLRDFINLDNHIFISFLSYKWLVKWFLSPKRLTFFNSYYEAAKKAILFKYDCRKPLPFENNSVDHILCSHFLEHVYFEECCNILEDYYRVLKVGGTVHIVLPDIEDMVRQYQINKQLGDSDAANKLMTVSLLSNKSRGSLIYRLLEFQGGFGLQHRWMYDYESISKKLIEKGFKLIDKNNKTPSDDFRINDKSIHIFCKKISKE